LGAVLLDACTVMMLVPVVVRDAGLKLMVSPVADGETDELSPTDEANPPAIVMVMVLVPAAPPCVTVRLAGDAKTLKFWTVSVMVLE
jgi:hypothetical protein